MPQKNGATSLAKQYTGAHGNASRAHLFDTVGAMPVNDTLVLGTFDAGTCIDEIRFNHDNLGASVTLDIGFSYIDGSAGSNLTAFGAALVASAAGVKRFEGKPVVLESRAQIIVTIKGAAATGRIDALVDYRYLGVSHKLA